MVQSGATLAPKWRPQARTSAQTVERHNYEVLVSLASKKIAKFWSQDGQVDIAYWTKAAQTRETWHELERDFLEFFTIE